MSFVDVNSVTRKRSTATSFGVHCTATVAPAGRAERIGTQSIAASGRIPESRYSSSVVGDGTGVGEGLAGLEPLDPQPAMAMIKTATRAIDELRIGRC